MCETQLDIKNQLISLGYDCCATYVLCSKQVQYLETDEYWEKAHKFLLLGTKQAEFWYSCFCLLRIDGGKNVLALAQREFDSRCA